MKIKKIIALSLICMLFAVTASHASENPQVKNSDTSGHWAEETIQKWIDLGYLTGYPNGNVYPNSYITRAEFVTLINRVLNFVDMSDKIWTDIKDADWFS